MKNKSKFIRCLSVLLCLFILNGCGTVRLDVPPGHEVRLLEPDEYAEIRDERIIWFWLWGGRPISDNSARTEIEKHHLKEVRLHTESSMTDNIVNVLLLWSTMARRTMIVEGNTDAYLSTPDSSPNNAEAKQ